MTLTIADPTSWLLLGALALVGYMVFEAHWLEVTSKTLCFKRLPPEFDGLRLVVVSDLHARRLGWHERRVIDRLRSIDGDMLIIAGDLKARNVTPNGPIIGILDALVEAVAHYSFAPVYARGNHDRRGFSRHCDERTDLHSLRDRSILLQRGGAVIQVAGTRRTCRVTRRMRPSLRKALRGLDPNRFTLFVSHSPDFFRMAARRGIDLMISGDTHGGQICLPGFGAPQSKSRLGRRFNRGHVQAWGAQIYVNRGVGCTGPPFRLACRPEIAVLTLRRQPDSAGTA